MKAVIFVPQIGLLPRRFPLRRGHSLGSLPRYKTSIRGFMEKRYVNVGTLPVESAFSGFLVQRPRSFDVLAAGYPPVPMLSVVNPDLFR